jgi:zinc/manganese transport system substrate-binding protein
MRGRRWALPVLVVTVAWVLVGCGDGGSSAGGTSGGSGTVDGKIRIVASTDVYGDIAQRIGGGSVQVTSIITDPNQDPHGFEASPQDLVAVSKASIVIENGGGYDDFMDTLRNSAHNDDVTVLNVVELSGFAAAQGDQLNEHVWYDFPTMATFVDQLAATLSRADPTNAGGYTANAKAFRGDLTRMQGEQAEIKAAHDGAGVAVTEPVPLYLLAGAGLVNKTPAAFSEAIENDTDVAPAVLNRTLQLFSDHQVVLLAYNEQTTGPQTEQVQQAARANNIPAQGFSETLPAGQDYVSWMNDNLTGLAAALGS